MQIKSLRPDLEHYLVKHNLLKKWQKTKRLFELDLMHPSLRTELLEPKWRGIFSLRLDKKYRALFLILDGEAEVFQFTKHYRKS